VFTSPRTALHAAAIVGLGLASLPAQADGELDRSYGIDGRTVVGFIESDSVQLRALARSPSGLRWMFGDDTADRRQLYISRSLANGNPDPGFGTNGSGQRRTALPANLIPQTEALAVEGALVQADGKPLVFGGLRPVNGETGAFPGLVCRLAVAGNLDAGFSGGCAQLRSFLGTEETCLVSDVAETSDGKFVVVGNCAGPGFAARPFLTRLLADGSIDFEFGAGAGLLTPVIPQALPIGQHFSAVAVRPDGLILVAAHFATIIGARQDRDVGLLQFDGGGSLDAQFGSGGLSPLNETLDTHEFARDVVVRSDGRALLLAQREVADLGNGRAGEQSLLMQVRTNGTLDPDFGSAGVVVDALDGRLGVGSNLRALALDASGRPILAGTRIAPSASPAQAGTDFWLAIPETVVPQADTQLLISADTATSGYVLNAALNIRLPFTVTPGQATVVTVPLAIELGGPNDNVFDKALRVTAEAPITLSVLTGRSFATDGSQILPARLLGTEHRIATWGMGMGSGSSLVVVASANNTLITVTPAVATPNRPAGVPFQVGLQQGQVYRLRVSPDGDLSGSVVSATRPVAVFGNHTCADIILGNPIMGSQCGSIVEQMPPVRHWGQDFLNVPTRQRPSGDVVRVYAQQDGTVVSIDGQVAAVLGAANFHQFSRTTPTRITSSAPVSVVRYAQSCRVDFPQNPCIGDVFMLGIAPIAQWQSRYSVVAPDRAFIGAYLHTLEIIAPLANVADVRVDGQSVPAASFVAIGSSGFAFAQVTSSSGAHRVTAPVPISVNAYGFLQEGGGEAYAFPVAAAASGGDADADDVLVRYTPGGQRDPAFGVAGVVLLDHRSAYGASLPSFDSAQRVLIDIDGILVGSASYNAASGQSLMLAYRLQGGSVFADGFESE
jgi:uncharacterized delta-60 repeat protein